MCYNRRHKNEQSVGLTCSRYLSFLFFLPYSVYMKRCHYIVLVLTKHGLCTVSYTLILLNLKVIMDYSQLQNYHKVALNQKEDDL